ncbi:uncharacterized protein [Ptychodera flava]|uniref:uncharacterized protein n=1 Tax=Ptychodera flava TaxID=63121 RepID=UPI00396AAB99
MCFAFLYIYPRILMDWCLTWTEWSETAAVVGIDEITPYGDPPIVLSPAEYAGQTVVQVLDSFDWDEQTIAELQRVNAEGYQGSAAFGGLAPDILEKYVFHRSIEVTDRLPTPPRACDVDDTLVLTTPDLSAGTESESMSFSATLPLVLFLGVLLWAAIALGRI